MWRYYGAQGRNRTTDTVIFSHVLYQLSYLGAVPAGAGRVQSGAGYKEKAKTCPVCGLLPVDGCGGCELTAAIDRSRRALNPLPAPPSPRTFGAAPSKPPRTEQEPHAASPRQPPARRRADDPSA